MNNRDFILGFHLRVSRKRMRAWTLQRRRSFLLRDDIRRPLSVDTGVWPNLKDDAFLASLFTDYSHGSPPNGLWLYTTLSQERLREPWSGSLVALTAALRDTQTLREWHKIEGDLLPVSWLRSNGFERLGYDVADRWLYSGLMNCALNVAKQQALSLKFGNTLNAVGLFKFTQSATKFRLECDKLIPQHAPFFVFGIWWKPDL